MLKISYENYLVCQMLFLLYKEGELDIEQVKSALAIQFGGKENLEKILKNFEKTLDK